MRDPTKDLPKRVGLFSRISSELRTQAFWVTVSTLIGGIAVVIAMYAAARVYLENRVNERVDDRIAPYLHLSSALSALRNEDKWGSLSELRDVVRSCSGESKDNISAFKPNDIMNCIGPSNFDAFADTYMWAIVYSDVRDFHEARDEFMNIVKILGEDVSQDGWRLQTLGLFHFRNGDMASALQALDKSIERYRDYGEFRASAWSHWYRALALSYLGEHTRAEFEFRASIFCSPREFRQYVLDGEEYVISEEDFLATLVARTPEFRLNVVNLIQDVRSSDLDGIGCQHTSPAVYDDIIANVLRESE